MSTILDNLPEQKVLLDISLATETIWNVEIDDDTLPWISTFDYFSLYSYDEGTDTFTLEWKDDFFSLDTTKWTILDDVAVHDDSYRTVYKSSQVSFDTNGLVVTCNPATDSLD